MASTAPLGKVAGRRKEWIRLAMAYSVAGAVSSAVVGAGLGLVGGTIPRSGLDPLATIAVGLVGSAVVLRETGLVPLKLWEPKRQTCESWGKRYPRTVAAALWGADLGFVVTTWFTFAGVWLILAVALFLGSFVSSAVLLVAYWLGRALSVWVAPAMLPEANATPQLMRLIDANRGLFRIAHVAAAIWLTGLVVLSGFH